MLKNIDRAKNVIASSILLFVGIGIVTLVFPSQIPVGLEGDLASDHYPNGIMFVWILSSLAWLISACMGHMDSVDKVFSGGWLNMRGIAAISIVGLGFLLFSLVGFLAAGFFLIVSLSYMCGERGAIPWVLGFIGPLGIFLFLDLVLDVTLPTFLQF